MTIASLRTLCVDRFPFSQTRPEIMAGFNRLVEIMVQNQIKGELLIDGSFITEKIDPDDIDFVLCSPAQFIEEATFDQGKLMYDIAHKDMKAEFRCHTFTCFRWPQGHPNHLQGEKWRKDWIDWFSKSRRGEEKGLAVIDLAGVSIT